jgi:uncharacterized membrane protein
MAGDDLATELTDEDRILLVFGYLGPLALVSLVASRKEFVKWHSKQGMLLFLTVVGLYVVLKPVHLVLKRYFWFAIADLFWASVSLVGLGILLLLLLCIVRALEGERFRVPILGDLVDQL